MKQILTNDNNNNSSNNSKIKSIGLRHICFNNCDGLTKDLMECLTTTRLRGVEFKDGDCSMPWNVLKVLLQSLNKMNSIEWVVFRSVYCYDEEAEREWLIGSERTAMQPIITNFKKYLKYRKKLEKMKRLYSWTEKYMKN
ncbi:hypothetical protein INT45_000224 [Circinella minor]|uniref:Uncharacterized protein n=1 Tax=Circinella minor TaxID=1195481 RepID=A0A8H7S4B7_9FUNG|nr:hypothetical protein INT45_000224 [Circinella minor]